jgi:hypothetical protein
MSGNVNWDLATGGNKEMDSLLFFLGDILSEWLTGNSSKSVLMRWVERIVVAVVIMLLTLVLFYMYRT